MKPTLTKKHTKEEENAITKNICKISDHPGLAEAEADHVLRKMGISMLSSKTRWIVALSLRVLTAVILLASLLILFKIRQGYKVFMEDKVLHFYDKVGYRYAACTITAGTAYSVRQTICAILRMKKGKRGNVLLDFYADKVISNLLVTGAAAGFVTTAQLFKDGVLHGQSSFVYHDTYASLSNSSSGLILLGCIFCSISSVLSSYALSRDDDN